MACSPRVRFIGGAIFVVVVLAGATLGLVLGLRTSPPPNGGSPTSPPGSGGGDNSTTPGPTPAFPESVSGSFRYAAVQTHTDICSSLGTSILGKHGGNAVDAAIASVLCVGVVNAHSCGIGGGFFMTLLAKSPYSSNLEVNTIISREVAPLNATRDMYVNQTEKAVRGGLAIGVPGEIAGLYRAWQLYGTVPWRDLVLPTAQLLEEGVPVETSLAEAIDAMKDIIKDTPQLKKIFFNKDGTPLKEGDAYTDPALAKTVRIIAEDPFSLYNGSLARDIVDDIQDADGIVSLADLDGYTPRVKDPVTAHLPKANLTLFAPIAPASGLILQFALRLIDSFGFGPEDVKDTDKAILTYHRLTEILKFAYAKRSALGDEEFVNITDLVANLTSDDYVSSIKARINDSFTQDVDYYGPSFEFSDAGTAHLSVVAPDGSAVSLTATINNYFGSMVRGQRTGIIFNNEMDDFSTPGSVNGFGVPASPSNFIVPGKMPMSSMAPALFVDGNNKLVLVTGGTGGTQITSGTAFVSMQHLYFEKGLKEATDTARIHHQLLPNFIVYEGHLDNGIIAGLKTKGHVMKQIIKVARIGSIAETCTDSCTGADCYTRKCLLAVSDGRKGGAPDGY